MVRCSNTNGKLSTRIPVEVRGQSLQIPTLSMQDQRPKQKVTQAGKVWKSFKHGEGQMKEQRSQLIQTKRPSRCGRYIRRKDQLELFPFASCHLSFTSRLGKLFIVVEAFVKTQLRQLQFLSSHTGSGIFSITLYASEHQFDIIGICNYIRYTNVYPKKMPVSHGWAFDQFF